MSVAIGYIEIDRSRSRTHDLAVNRRAVDIRIAWRHSDWWTVAIHELQAASSLYPWRLSKRAATPGSSNDTVQAFPAGAPPLPRGLSRNTLKDRRKVSLSLKADAEGHLNERHVFAREHLLRALDPTDTQILAWATSRRGSELSREMHPRQSRDQSQVGELEAFIGVPFNVILHLLQTPFGKRGNFSVGLVGDPSRDPFSPQASHAGVDEASRARWKLFSERMFVVMGL